MNSRMKILEDLEALFEGRLAKKLKKPRPDMELEGEGDVPLDLESASAKPANSKKPPMKPESFEAETEPPGSEEGGDPKAFLEQEGAEELPPGMSLDNLTTEEQQQLEELYKKLCGKE